MSITVVECADLEVRELAETVFANAYVGGEWNYQNTRFPELLVTIDRRERAGALQPDTVAAMRRWIDLCRSPAESSRTLWVDIVVATSEGSVRFRRVFPVQLGTPCAFAYSPERAGGSLTAF